ncbi:unnamed protein product [Meloidogyne enterolobii]|uniref:Uncharacterized protein n=1 Tax=Meloidogyne enterolobii TaxID=390850 RepID=A0ACB0Y4W9_MELEN
MFLFVHCKMQIFPITLVSPLQYTLRACQHFLWGYDFSSKDFPSMDFPSILFVNGSYINGLFIKK